MGPRETKRLADGTTGNVRECILKIGGRMDGQKDREVGIECRETLVMVVEDELIICPLKGHSSRYPGTASGSSQGEVSSCGPATRIKMRPAIRTNGIGSLIMPQEN